MSDGKAFVCVSVNTIRGPADAYWRELSLGNKGNCHLKWDHRNNKSELWIAFLNSRVQASPMFASIKDSFNYTLYATLTDNSIKMCFFSLKIHKSPTGFRHDECICVPLQLRRAARWNSCAAHSIIKKRYFLRWLRRERENKSRSFAECLTPGQAVKNYWRECRDKFSAS